MENMIYTRIKERLIELGISERAASIKATGNAETIRRIRTGGARNPRIDTIEKLADALETTSNWLLGDGAAEARPADSQDALVIQKNLNPPGKDIPVYGLAAGSTSGAFHVTTEPIEYVAQPAGLLKVPDAYALRVTGNSMSPKYEPDDIIFINPHRPIRPDDYVIIQQKANSGIATSIKRYRTSTEKHHITSQFNPASEMQYPIETVKYMHRVLTVNEVLGA